MSSIRGNRALQRDIDHCFKEVDHGIADFHELFRKCEATEGKNHKKKLAGDLKSKIAKLQRQRDQIKEWANMNQAKHKIDELNQYKGRIEDMMQIFRKFETAKNTKEYSERGLEKPKTKKQEKTEKWIRDSIFKLNKLLEVGEGKIEKLTKGKKKKGKYANQDDIDRLHEEEKGLRFHVNKLEVLLREITDEEISSENADEVKDDVEYYIKCVEDDEEYCGDHYQMYDGLMMGEEIQTTVAAAAASRVVEEAVVATDEDDEVSTTMGDGFKQFAEEEEARMDNEDRISKQNAYEGSGFNGMGDNAFKTTNETSKNVVGSSASNQVMGGNSAFREAVQSDVFNQTSGHDLKEVGQTLKVADGCSSFKEVVQNGGNGADNVETKKVNGNNVQKKESAKINGGKLEIDFSAVVRPGRVNGPLKNLSNMVNGDRKVDLNEIDFPRLVISPPPQEASSSHNDNQNQSQISNQKVLQSNPPPIMAIDQQHLDKTLQSQQASQPQDQVAPSRNDGEPSQDQVAPSLNDGAVMQNHLQQCAPTLQESQAAHRSKCDEYDSKWMHIKNLTFRNLFTFNTGCGCCHSHSYFSHAFPTVKNKKKSGLGNFDLLPPTDEDNEFRLEDLSLPINVDGTEGADDVEKNTRMLQSSLNNQPTREQTRPITTPYRTPFEGNWPSNAIPVNAMMIEKMDQVTLLFIFNTHTDRQTRISAARKLIKIGWGYHLDHHLWLRRLERPISQDRECEVASYYYYQGQDYSVKKAVRNFRFEYRFLARNAEEVVALVELVEKKK